jgi:hypothetical protein
MALLRDQLIGLECERGGPEDCLFVLSHRQNEDLFECVSCASD